MKSNLVLALGSVLALLPALARAAGASAGSGAARPFAVVELFTSEGCSSCPAADRFLAKLVAESRQSTGAIYPLAFHVDYWDRLGWKDRFSDPAYSQRQNEYVQALGLDSAYTPQMIVNGKEEFIGSDESRARRSIATALERPPALTLELTAGAISDGVLPVDFAVSGSSRAVLRLAVVERNLESQVSRGENSGRKLTHENVVRVFQSVPVGPTRKGHASVPLPASLVTSHASLIAYAQDPVSLEILGAAAVDLP